MKLKTAVAHVLCRLRFPNNWIWAYYHYKAYNLKTNLPTKHRAELDSVALSERLNATLRNLKVLRQTVLEEAYNRGVAFKCVFCGYEIPWEKDKEATEAKVKIHVELCVAKLFEATDIQM